jgi:hypothetical protein
MQLISNEKRVCEDESVLNPDLNPSADLEERFGQYAPVEARPPNLDYTAGAVS